MKTTPVVLQLFFAIALLFSTVAAAPAPSYAAPAAAAAPGLSLPPGVPCPYDSFFTCITIDVPLDHFNSADTRTIPVVFAILPASGVRKGMFVVATGGPGTSGVLLADFYSSGYDPSILDSFDIVFFDQRGMGLSGGLTCPSAAVHYYLQDARSGTPAEEAALKQVASTFSTDCVNELINPDLLPFMGTRQAVEDLEIFRQLVGDDKFWLYGESYGTQYAQTYAAAHGDHLAGLILDATVDMTLSGFQFYTEQAQAFNDTLVDTLSFCGTDPACSAAMNGDPVAAYDALAAQLAQGPIRFRFPLPWGGFQRREFTLSNLEFVAASQMYGEGDRMMFNRALAYYAANGDIVPLARLFYLGLGVDPQTLDVIPDEVYSDAVFFGVECQDYGYPGSTPEEKANNYIAAGDPVDASIPRLSSIFYGDLPCAYWPHATSNLTRPGYLQAPGVPTLVLGATADPATPVSHGMRVYQNLADGYLITQMGGPHVIFGYGNACPDALVTDFLVSGIVPAQRETICDGYLADDYVPIAPRHAGAFGSPLEALSSAETEISYLPEYYYWDGFDPQSAGCTYGGTFGFESNFRGTRYLFDLQECAFSRNFIMTGKGSYTFDNDRFVLDVRVTGRWTCDLKYVRNGDRIKLTGKCNGQSVNKDDNDDDDDDRRHKSPNTNKRKDDD